MSALAQNVRPAQISTIAAASASSTATFKHSSNPERTACDSPFTGGSSTVITPTRSLRSYVTTPLIGRLLHPPFNGSTAGTDVPESTRIQPTTRERVVGFTIRLAADLDGTANTEGVF
jgi:hypothetical protein